jgi:hypothetical protein
LFAELRLSGIALGGVGMGRPSLLRAVVCLLGIVLGTAQCAPNPARSFRHSADLVQKVENHPDDGPTVLVLKDGQRFQTTIFDVRVLGMLRTARKAPYLVLGGRSCNQCDANTTIYIHSPSDGPMQNEAKQTRYTYPGHEVSYENGPIAVYEARTFIGNCLPGHDNSVVWHQRSRARDGNWVPSVFIVSVKSDSLASIELDHAIPPLSLTLQQVSAGECFEVEGIEQGTEP